MNPDSNAIFRRFVSKAKLRHFVLLIRLFELGNMKRTAQALGMSQPAVSLMVAELEQLLGVELFRRHSRGVDPTRVTTELLPVARRIVAAIGDGSEIVSNIVNDSAGFVRISATPAAISALIHPVALTFARRFPNVHIEISEIAVANPLQALSDGTCDILSIRKPEIIPENWQFESCLSDALVVLCGKRNPLARKAFATLDDLAGANWLLTRRGSVARDRFEDLAEEMNLPVENRCGVITHVPMVTQELLEQGNYLTLVPRSVAASWLRNGIVHELDSPATTALAPLGFLWQGDNARRVTKMVANELRSRLGGTHPG